MSTDQPERPARPERPGQPAQPAQPGQSSSAARLDEQTKSAPQNITRGTEYPTLREPFTATGEAFSVPLERLVPHHPTLQEATMTTQFDPASEYGAAGHGTSEYGASEHAGRQPSTARRRRSADPVSIGAGLVFFLLGGAYLLASGGHLTVNAGWTLSFLLLGLGLSGVLGALLRARSSSRSHPNIHPDDWS